MADENENNEEEEDFGALTGGSDSGMGNLPPLSDFDSADGESDGGGDLPPMDGGDTPSESGLGGLPPIVDIKVDTPAVRPSDLDTPDPTNASPTPAGFDTPAEELDTPDPADGLGFQDFAADSDFSPETPEIGPGPDSDIETPMFDSAFGGDSDDFSTGGTPTQAMETPMFDSGVSGGGDAGGMGFDNDAFGADTPGGGVDDGTPIPDFSPDTGMPQEMGAVAAGKKGKKGGGGSPVKTILVGVVFLLLGAIGGFVGNPSLAEKVTFIKNPFLEKIGQLETKIESQDKQIDRMMDSTSGGEDLTQEQIDAMIVQLNETKASLGQATQQRDTIVEELLKLREDVVAVEGDLEEVNEQYVVSAEELENLIQENAITDSRHRGLLAENERLTDMVGELEIANDRRGAVQDTLLHNIDQLTIQIRGGSPLTPTRYSHNARLERVEDLREKVAKAKWATPQLLSEYTELYIAELGVASVREYFFASIPVTDGLGNQSNRWAECLMNGNWSVYFRTLDGDHIGSFENTAGGGVPNYEFREDFPNNIKAEIASQIMSSRVDDFQEKIKALRAKEAVYDSRSSLEKKFSSLAP